MSDNISNIIPLSCVCQNYAWGKMGDTSAVAKLAFLNKDIQIDQSQPYAEYWFGTHKKGPATIKKNEKQLKTIENDRKRLKTTESNQKRPKTIENK